MADEIERKWTARERGALWVAVGWIMATKPEGGDASWLVSDLVTLANKLSQAPTDRKLNDADVEAMGKALASYWNEQLSHMEFPGAAAMEDMAMLAYSSALLRAHPQTEQQEGR